MWIAIPMNLIAIMFVIFLIAITKLWMFDAPKTERHIPAYSLHVMKSLPPDKPVVKKDYNPYSGAAKIHYDASGRKVSHGSVSAASKPSQQLHNAPHKPAAGRYDYSQPAPSYAAAPQNPAAGHYYSQPAPSYAATSQYRAAYGQRPRY